MQRHTNLQLLRLALCALILPAFVYTGWAQNTGEKPELPLPHLIVQTGIGFQLFDEGYKMTSLSIERPIGEYWNLGIQGHFFHKNSHSAYYFDPYAYQQYLGGREYGLSAEYFLHGRLSGRKSGFYTGMQIMAGQRWFQYNEDVSFPPRPMFKRYNVNTTKFMFRWGMQWRLGKHASLEFSAPFGMEFSKPSEVNGYTDEDAGFVIMPMLQLGIGL
ncbi:MAG: hypothetical protein SFV22_07100 [Saprospiraceae bacterium]|nr:hypothetical protein [Saprospiraceae bacterium]